MSRPITVTFEVDSEAVLDDLYTALLRARRRRAVRDEDARHPGDGLSRPTTGGLGREPRPTAPRPVTRRSRPHSMRSPR